LEELTLSYPFTKPELFLRIASAAASTGIFTALAFNTTETFFILGFTAAFPVLTALLFLVRWRGLRRALPSLLSDGIYSELKKAGAKRELLLYMVVFILPILIFPLIDPVLALACLLAAVSSFGTAESVFYLYVRQLENGIGRRITVFIRPAPGNPGFYVKGLKLV